MSLMSRMTEKDSLAGCSLSGYRDEWIGTNQTVFQVDDAGNIEDDGTRSLNPVSYTHLSVIGIGMIISLLRIRIFQMEYLQM